MENAVYKGNDLKVAGLVKPGDRVGPFKVVPLPGHTFGHVGFYAEGILYAGNALFGRNTACPTSWTSTRFWRR